MWFFVVTVMLTFTGGDHHIREYKLETFNEVAECRQFITDNKVLLLIPHLIEYGEKMTSFEFNCEKRFEETI